MSEEIKNEEVKEEEVVEATEEAVETAEEKVETAKEADETTPEKSELELANERAEDFEKSKGLANSSAVMFEMSRLSFSKFSVATASKSFFVVGLGMTNSSYLTEYLKMVFNFSSGVLFLLLK